MSKATPYIAKITISTSTGPYTDTAAASSTFAIYDNSGAAPGLEVPFVSTCVLRSLARSGQAALIGTAYMPPAWDGGALVWWYPVPLVAFDQGLAGLTFNYEIYFGSATLILNAPAPVLIGGTAYQGGTLSVYQGTVQDGNGAPFLGWVPVPLLGNDYQDLGFSVKAIGSGAFGLAYGIWNDSPVSPYWYNMQTPVGPLDFDGVDLSGEDYSGVKLMSFRAGRPGSLPLLDEDTFLIAVSSTWAYADLSNTNFSGNTIGDAAFDHAVLNGTDFRGTTLLNTTFRGAIGTSPDFSGARLGSVSFAGATITTPVFDIHTSFHGFSGGGFNGPFYSDTDFSGAVLPNSDFSNLDLNKIHFSNCDFTGAKFNGAMLQGAVFDGATLTNADFSGAQLQGATFNGAKLTNANFSGAQLQGTQFTNTDVTQTIFSTNPQFATTGDRTSFTGSKIPLSFNGNNWTFLDLSGASFPVKPATITNLNAQSARLCGMDFSHITFLATDAVNNPTNFSNSVLAQADFSNANLNSARFSSANAEPDSMPATPYNNSANFSGANLEDARFDGAFLAGVDFSYALLWGGQATLAGATLTDASFANAFLASAKFDELEGAQCGGVDFTGACLVNACFNGTTLREGAKGKQVIFDDAFLQGVDFGGATFTAVSLNGAVLATGTGSIMPIFATRPPGVAPIFGINYPATKLEISQTTSGTICVDGSPGACTTTTLAPQEPMPTQWTWRAV